MQTDLSRAELNFALSVENLQEAPSRASEIALSDLHCTFSSLS